jgi:uncharacterized protein (DUF697 family)
MSSHIETLKRILNGNYDGATPEERDRAVREVLQIGSVAAAAVAVQPFPLVDALLISPIQILMVQAIGKIRGHTLDSRSVLEILSTFGASLVTQNLILAAAKLIPFAGWLVGISMAYALTWAIGEVSDHYFKHGRGVPQEDLKGMFDKVYRQKRAEKEASHSSDRSLKQRLEQLKEAREAGLISEEEFTAKKEDLLRGF